MSDTTNDAHKKTLLTTILGALLWILTGSGASIIAHFLPDSVMLVLHTLGELIAAIGGLSMFHQNTVATKDSATATATATAAAVTQAITNAPVNLASNPSVVAAQSARNPLTNK